MQKYITDMRTYSICIYIYAHADGMYPIYERIDGFMCLCRRDLQFMPGFRI